MLIINRVATESKPAATSWNSVCICFVEVSGRRHAWNQTQFFSLFLPFFISSFTVINSTNLSFTSKHIFSHTLLSAQLFHNFLAGKMKTVNFVAVPLLALLFMAISHLGHAQDLPSPAPSPTSDGKFKTLPFSFSSSPFFSLWVFLDLYKVINFLLFMFSFYNLLIWVCFWLSQEPQSIKELLTFLCWWLWASHIWFIDFSFLYCFYHGRI